MYVNLYPSDKKALSSASLLCGLLPWTQKVALKSWTVRILLHSFSSMCCHVAGGSLKNLLLMRILYLKIVLLLTVKMDRISYISSKINFIFHNLFQLHATFLSFLLIIFFICFTYEPQYDTHLKTSLSIHSPSILFPTQPLIFQFPPLLAISFYVSSKCPDSFEFS